MYFSNDWMKYRGVDVSFTVARTAAEEHSKFLPEEFFTNELWRRGPEISAVGFRGRPAFSLELPNVCGYSPRSDAINISEADIREHLVYGEFPRLKRPSVFISEWKGALESVQHFC